MLRHGLCLRADNALALHPNPIQGKALKTGRIRRASQRTKKTVPKWYCLFVGAPGRIRTCDLPVRSRALYPLSYGRVYLLNASNILTHKFLIVNTFFKKLVLKISFLPIDKSKHLCYNLYVTSYIFCVPNTFGIKETRKL